MSSTLNSRFDSSSLMENAQIQVLQKKIEALRTELNWRKGGFARLEHYVANTRYIASEHQGKVAIAVFSCVADLPFDPFDHALSVENSPLSRTTIEKFRLKKGHTWFRRFIAYYSSLDSHLLSIYKDKEDQKGNKLAEHNRPTLTGVLCDPQSPVFDRVYKQKTPFSNYLDRATYGLDMIVKVFPIFDDLGELMGMVSFTHDISIHLEQQILINDGLKNIQSSAHKIFSHVGNVQKVSSEIHSFSSNIEKLENSMDALIKGGRTLEESLHQSVEALKFLSLNLKISASQVGIEGKKFSVIAEEAYKLIDSMGQTVKNMSTVITQMHDIKGDGVDKLKSVNHLSTQINHIAEELKNEGVGYQSLIDTISLAEKGYRDYIKNMTEDLGK